MVVEDILEKCWHDGVNKALYKFVTDNNTATKHRCLYLSMMDDSSQACSTNKGGNRWVKELRMRVSFNNAVFQHLEVTKYVVVKGMNY